MDFEVKGQQVLGHQNGLNSAFVNITGHSEQTWSTCIFCTLFLCSMMNLSNFLAIVMASLSNKNVSRGKLKIYYEIFMAKNVNSSTH